jgi:hypothetical protein
MSDLIRADYAELAPSKAAPSASAEFPDLSDDECVTRLARAIATYDSEHLDEVVRLIGRLAVTIE